MKRIGISAACVAALILGSCSQLQQQQRQAPKPQPVEGGEEQVVPEGQVEPSQDKKESDKTESEELSTVVPSSEQQEAALNMLREQENDAMPTVSSTGEIPEPIADSSFDSPLPGGRGLRMGNLAPPEEAASSSENAAPKPNSVERYGLRSPSLPKGLPMDINGKLTPTN